MPDDTPSVGCVMISEGALRNRDGCAPRGPGDVISLVRQSGTLRSTPDEDHKQTYKEERHVITDVVERKDPRTGRVRRMFHVTPDG